MPISADDIYVELQTLNANLGLLVQTAQAESFAQAQRGAMLAQNMGQIKAGISAIGTQLSNDVVPLLSQQVHVSVAVATIAEHASQQTQAVICNLEHAVAALSEICRRTGELKKDGASTAESARLLASIAKLVHAQEAAILAQFGDLRGALNNCCTEETGERDTGCQFEACPNPGPYRRG